jgi:uncharacterized membrane protein YeiH
MIFRELLELLGIASFAVSGALAARRKQLDVFGILVIAFATAIGGGTVRDILIGDTPVAWLRDWATGAVILAGYGSALLFNSYWKRFEGLLAIFDAIGLGLFTIVGLQRGLEAGLGPASCVTLGMITGCFGGVLRDVLLNEIPLIFHRDIYALASLVGGAAYFVLAGWSVAAPFAATAASALIIALRLAVLRYGWELSTLRRKSSDESP